MSEARPRSEISRAEFLKFTALIASGLLLPNWLGVDVARATESRISSSEQFDTAPSWEQDFSRLPDGQPSAKYWNYVTGNIVPGYNNEAETYTDRPRNVRVEDGVLIIEALEESFDGRKCTSGRIDTQGKFDFTFGKLEVDLRIPSGIGSWPAAWLLPSNPRYNPAQFGLRGASADWELNGEIDFMETVGSEIGKIYPDVHTVANDKVEQKNLNPFFKSVPDDAVNFHRYGIEKLPDSIVFTLDGFPYHRFNKPADSPLSWPFDQNYFLVLNLAMGGTWGNGCC